MARMARAVVPDIPHHVTQRGNRGQRVFFSGSDFRLYIRLMAECCADAEVAIWGWCLMPNHVHLVMQPAGVDGLREALARAHRRYTLAINERENWRGYLWQGRFFSTPMDEPHTLMALRYIEQNPVRAGLCGRPQEWPWSSARRHLGLPAAEDQLTDTRPIKGLVTDWQPFLDDVPPGAAIDALRQHTRTGRPFGRAAFIEGVERILERKLAPSRRGRPKVGSRDVEG